MNFRIADIYEDAEILKTASEYAKEIDEETLKKLDSFTLAAKDRGNVTL